METIQDVIRQANIEGLKGNLVVAVIPPQTASSGGYSIAVKKYEVETASDYDLRW